MRPSDALQDVRRPCGPVGCLATSLAHQLTLRRSRSSQGATLLTRGYIPFLHKKTLVPHKKIFLQSFHQSFLDAMKTLFLTGCNLFWCVHACLCHGHVKVWPHTGVLAHPHVQGGRCLLAVGRRSHCRRRAETADLQVQPGLRTHCAGVYV